MTTDSAVAPAREGRVAVAAGDVDRTCPGCGVNDDHPRHIVSGLAGPVEMATLPDGRQFPVQVPRDVAYHHDCHATAGCHYCQELIAAQPDSTTRGKDADSITVPEHLVEIEPHEFTHDEAGVLTRVRDKAEARQVRLRDEAEMHTARVAEAKRVLAESQAALDALEKEA